MATELTDEQMATLELVTHLGEVMRLLPLLPVAEALGSMIGEHTIGTLPYRWAIVSHDLIIEARVLADLTESAEMLARRIVESTDVAPPPPPPMPMPVDDPTGVCGVESRWGTGVHMHKCVTVAPAEHLGMHQCTCGASFSLPAVPDDWI